MTLDRFQESAVYSEARNILVVAPPGSGKTTVMLNRVVHLVRDRKISPGNIIVLTFTKSAAGNMKKRYISMNSGEGIPFFGTFHGLFYKVLKRHIPDLQIMNTSIGYEIVRNILTKKLSEVSDEKVKEIVNSISRYKNSYQDIDEFDVSIDKEIFKECFSVYEEYRTSNNLYDFDDLQIQFKKLLEEDENLRKGYSRLFKYILVDEFQDCDNLQIEILKMLNEDSNHLYAVGDEDQCIYSFRGSRPECMVEFGKIFKQSEKIFLYYNYRSPKNIVDYSKRIISKNKIRNDKKIDSFSKKDGELYYFTPYNEEGQSSDIVKRINKSIEQGYRYGDNIILYRTNVESRSIIDSLIREKIPFAFLDKEYNFFEHFICKDILAYLKLSIDMYDVESFKRIINKPYRYISKIAINDVETSRIKSNVFDTLIGSRNIKDFTRNKMANLKRDISYLNKTSLRSAIDTILNTLGYNEYLTEYAIKFKINVDEIYQMVDEFKVSAEPFKTIIQLLAHVEETTERIRDIKRDNVRDSVLLSTIHGAKGREYRNVFLINIDEDYLPHMNADDIEEERRLYYVAVTRAKNNLYLYSPKTLSGKFKNPSMFINESVIKDYSSNNVDKKMIDNIVEHKSFGRGRVLSLEKGNIKIMFDDGITRSFNLDILMQNNLLRIISKKVKEV